MEIDIAWEEISSMHLFDEVIICVCRQNKYMYVSTNQQ